MNNWDEIQKNFNNRIFFENPPNYPFLEQILKKAHPNLSWLHTTETYTERQLIEGEWTYESKDIPINVHFLKTKPNSTMLAIEFPHFLVRPVSIYFESSPTSHDLQLQKAVSDLLSRDIAFEITYSGSYAGGMTASAFLKSFKENFPEFQWHQPSSYRLIGENDDGFEIVIEPSSVYVLSPKAQGSGHGIVEKIKSYSTSLKQNS